MAIRSWMLPIMSFGVSMHQSPGAAASTIVTVPSRTAFVVAVAAVFCVTNSLAVGTDAVHTSAPHVSGCLDLHPLNPTRSR